MPAKRKRGAKAKDVSEAATEAATESAAASTETAAAAPTGDDVTRVGHCACGAVEITVVGPAKETMYCSCSLCRRFHSAPVTVCGGWSAPDKIWVSKGADNLGSFSCTEKYERFFCKTCGTRTHGIMGQAKHLMLTFHSLFDGLEGESLPASWKATAHLFWGNRVGDVKEDGVKRYIDLPTEWGGSGKVAE